MLYRYGMLAYTLGDNMGFDPSSLTDVFLCAMHPVLSISAYLIFHVPTKITAEKKEKGALYTQFILHNTLCECSYLCELL